jgi:hypothetical protein
MADLGKSAKTTVGIRLGLAVVVVLLGTGGCGSSTAGTTSMPSLVSSAISSEASSPTDAPSPIATTLSTQSLRPMSAGAFVATGNMHTAREDATATLLQNGKVLIAGGTVEVGTSWNPFASAELFDPATGKFTETGSMTAARVNHTATLLADGRVLIAGGYGCSDPKHCSNVAASTPVAPLASAELYDPKTGKFTPTGSMTAARALATATRLPDGRVLLAEGLSLPNPTADLYDPQSGTFVSTGQGIGLLFATAVLLPNGKVLVAGLFRQSISVGAELYDEAAGKFTKISLALAPGAEPSVQYKGSDVARTWPQATLFGDGRVLVFNSGYLETYDPATGTCAYAGFISAGAQWVGETATLLADGRVLFEGGSLYSDPATYTYVMTNSAVVYDPSGESSATGLARAARTYHTATLLSDGSVLIAGGEDSSYNPTASAELFKP